MNWDWRKTLACFFRTYLVGACFNTRGLQNVGLAFAMEPGLRALYRDPASLKQARKRHLRLYNTHPYWTPFLVGYFLFLERKIAQGSLPPRALGRIRQTTSYTLSAIGDSVFGGSLLIFWSLSTICLLLYDQRALAFVWFGVALAAIQVFKAFTFWRGLTSGLTFLQKVKAWDLINKGQRVKITNALLLLLIWYRMYPIKNPPWDSPWTFWVWAGLVVLCAWIAERTMLFRESVVVAMGMVFLFWPVLVELWTMVLEK